MTFLQWSQPLLFIAANGSFLHHLQIVLVWCAVFAASIATLFYYHTVDITFEGTTPAPVVMGYHVVLPHRCAHRMDTSADAV